MRNVMEQADDIEEFVLELAEERAITRREVMKFIDEGDFSTAWFRMQRGYERQVRLSGLEGIVKESFEQERRSEQDERDSEHPRPEGQRVRWALSSMWRRRTQ